MAQLGVQPGSVVADVGCGTGLFAGAAAEAVGPYGLVHALDVQPAMIEALMAAAPPPHVHARPCPEDAIPLPDGSVDLVLLAFVLHEAVDADRILRETARVLRSGGRVACLEWEGVVEDRGPPLEHRLPSATVAERMARAGLGPEAPLPWTPTRYLLVAHKPDSEEPR